MSLEADFVQTRHSSMMSGPQISLGHMSYHAPDYLQWAYTSPETMVWEINGSKSNVNPHVQRLLRMIMNAVEGQDPDSEKVKKETKKFFQSVNIIIDEKTGVAKQVEMTEKNGDKTIIEFKNVVFK